MNNIFNTAAYKRSRAAYMAQCTIEYFVSILVADAFLAKLLTHIGISDSLTGIISSFITLAFLFQLLSVFLVKKMKDTKKTVIFFDTVSQIFFMLIYLVPFMPASRSVKTVIVVALVLAAYLFKYLVIGVYFKWANSFVEPTKRGEYSAVKEMISLLSGIVFTLVVGYAVDRFEATGNIEGSFIFLAIVLFLLNLSNFITLVLISRDKTDDEPKGNKASLRVVAKNTFGNKNFVNVIILTVLWDVGRYASIGFMGVFKTNDLLLSVGLIQVINMVGNLVRFVISKPFGRFSDKTSYATGIKIALVLAAIGFGVNAFATKATWWCVAVYSVFYAVSLAGINQNMFNISYSYVDSDYIVQAMAIKNSIGGICGFAATIIGSRILSHIQSNGNMFFGIPMYGQQLLSAISFAVLIAAAVFTHKVISKQKVMIQ